MSRLSTDQQISTVSNLTSRRAFVAALGTWVTASLTDLNAQTPARRNTRATAAAPKSPAAPKRPTHLQAPQGIDQLATRSRIVLQLSGMLKVADPDPSSKKPPREAEVKAESTVDFDERVVFDASGSAEAAARRYHEASVKSWIAGHASSHDLRSECTSARLIRNEGVWQQYCSEKTLQPREVDLLRLPVNTVVIDQMLPPEPVKGDSSWTLSDRAIAELFHLEAIHSSTLSAHVAEVVDGVAKIEYEGVVEGTIHSVPTKLSISGNLNAVLGSRCALVTWVGMSLTETRAISQSEPGFTLTARIKLIRKEEPQACMEVAEDELRALAASDDDARWLLQFASIPGRYQFLADRRWKTIVDTGEESILRLVEKNQVVAQCNITRLPKLAAGQQLTLAGMQDDIKRSLDTGLEAMLEASERKTSSGLRVLRTVAVGKSSDVPVRWVYSHISDDSGRRISLVFTMSGEAAEAFALADEQMTSSFELLPEPTDAAPTQAAPTPAATIEAANKPVQRTTKR